MNEREVRSALSALLDFAILPDAPRRVTGGCINECFRYETARGAIFVKAAAVESLEMFSTEAAGLKELRFVEAVRVPEVIAVGSADELALLAIEWIDLQSPTRETNTKCGAQLASLHRFIQSQYGWEQNNFIGSTPQTNTSSTDWLHFWRTHRLGAQLNLAERKGANAHFMERATLLSALMDGFFTSHHPDASLLHGDLWGGNYAADSSGAPVLFDPAVYYGDRECDLAMTRLFGDFDRNFYAAYEDAWPLDDDWQSRVDLYNLYHVLNHYNLFGGAYLQQAEGMVGKLLAELGH